MGNCRLLWQSVNNINHSEHMLNKTGDAMSYVPRSMEYGMQCINQTPAKQLGHLSSRTFMEHSAPTGIPFDKTRLKCLPSPPGIKYSPPNAPRCSPGMQPQSTARKYSGSFFFFGILKRSPDLKTFFFSTFLELLYLPLLHENHLFSEAGFLFEFMCWKPMGVEGFVGELN